MRQDYNDNYILLNGFNLKPFFIDKKTNTLWIKFKFYMLINFKLKYVVYLYYI